MSAPVEHVPGNQERASHDGADALAGGTPYVMPPPGTDENEKAEPEQYGRCDVPRAPGPVERADEDRYHEREKHRVHPRVYCLKRGPQRQERQRHGHREAMQCTEPGQADADAVPVEPARKHLHREHGGRADTQLYT